MLPLDRWLMLGVPAALLVATRAVQTSFLSWTHLAVVLGAWLVFVLVVRLLVGRRSPWPVIAAVGGVVVLRCIVTLLALSFTGPGGYWFAFWTEPTRRTVYIAVAFALFVWLFVAAGWALAAQLGRRRATGIVLAAVGAGLAVPALIVALVGLEQALTVWNDEMGLLPVGPRAHPRHHGLPRHPRGHGVVRRRLRAADRRRRRAARAALRARRSPRRTGGGTGRRPDELAAGQLPGAFPRACRRARLDLQGYD